MIKSAVSHFLSVTTTIPTLLTTVVERSAVVYRVVATAIKRAFRPARPASAPSDTLRKLESRTEESTPKYAARTTSPYRIFIA